MSDAVIHLLERRTGDTLNGCHSFHVFPAAGDIFLKGVLAFNEHALLPSATANIQVALGELLFLMPTIGAVECGISGMNSFIEAGQCFVFPATVATELCFRNPYDQETVNFICGRLQYKGNKFKPDLSSFDLDSSNDALVPLFREGKCRASIGKFSGRVDVQKVYEQPTNVFAYIIEGAFEVQNRLLQSRDALSLSNVPALEFEALSNQAIIFVLEFEK